MTMIFLYKIIFVIEILSAEAMFMFNLKRRTGFVKRTALASLICIVAAVLFPAISSNAIYSFFMFLCLFSVTVFVQKFCYNESWTNILFCCIAAYSTQHFAYEFTNMVFTTIFWASSPISGLYSNTAIDLSAIDLKTVLYAFIYLTCLLTAYVVIFFVFCKRLKKTSDLKLKSFSLLMLVGIALLVNIIINSIIVSIQNFDITASLIICLYNCLCCLLLLQVQFGLVQFENLETEFLFVKRLLAQEKEQYAASKENIDLINFKCHDLKHKIRKFGTQKNLSDEEIAEMEQLISIYDSSVKTDNEVLDTILTEKSLVCLKNKIVLSCVADGSTITFLKDSDIYSLFGNILDNAINAVMKIEEEEKRVISLKVLAFNKIVTLNVKNFYTGEITFGEDDLPKTKRNTDYHGYGMKSIRYIVNKYDGNLNITAKDGVFNLNILFPVP